MKSVACSIRRERGENHCFSTHVASWISKRNIDRYATQSRTLSNFLDNSGKCTTYYLNAGLSGVCLNWFNNSLWKNEQSPLSAPLKEEATAIKGSAKSAPGQLHSTLSVADALSRNNLTPFLLTWTRTGGSALYTIIWQIMIEHLPPQFIESISPLTVKMPLFYIGREKFSQLKNVFFLTFVICNQLY